MRGQPPGGGGVGLALTLCCLLVRGPPLTHPHSPRAGTRLATSAPLPRVPASCVLCLASAEERSDPFRRQRFQEGRSLGPVLL